MGRFFIWFQQKKPKQLIQEKVGDLKKTGLFHYQLLFSIEEKQSPIKSEI